jgi:F0F1-type ATP synthase assembly protein I
VSPETPDSKEFGRLVAMGQVGLEMVVPIVLGMVLDHYLAWDPWGLVGGAAIGFFGGLAHLVHLAAKEDAATRKGKPPQDTPETDRS